MFTTLFQPSHLKYHTIKKPEAHHRFTKKSTKPTKAATDAASNSLINYNQIAVFFFI